MNGDDQRELAVTSDQEVSGVERTPRGHEPGTYRVLFLVEDRVARQAVAEGLGAHGFEIVVVERSEEAARQLVSGGFDAALLDLMLGSESGLAVARRLRQAHPSLPVMLISGYAVPPGEVDLGGLGAVGFAQKPLRVAALARTLHERLDDA